ncbi:MAG: sigma-70 family RNA polymerase sigma factor [Actinomycetota bacterium]
MTVDTGDGTDGAHDYEALYREAGPQLWRTLYGVCAGRTDLAEEAIAEAFARVIERGDRVRDPIAYVYRVAFRVATQELKRERRQSDIAEQAHRETPGELEDLMRALRELSPNQRAAVILRFEADLSTEEVAKRMGVSAATVRVHIHRGRKKLRALLGTQEVSDA